MATDPVVLYIGGCGRSGSTLLDRILGQVPGYASVGELFLLVERGLDERELCGCGERFSDCPFWTEVVSRAFAGHGGLDEVRRLQSRVDRNRHLARLVVPRAAPRAARDDTARYASALRSLYRTIADVAGAQVVVDSSKHVSTAWVLQRAGLDVRLLHLVRDARGMAYSWTKAVPKPESPTGELMDRFPPHVSAARWVGYNLAFEALAHADIASTRVFYEDLVRDPQGVLTAVARDLSLPLQPDFSFLADAAPDLAFTHTVAGNPVRFAGGPIRLAVDDAWRRDMPAGQRRAVTGITAPLLAGYGYLGGRRG